MERYTLPMKALSYNLYYRIYRGRFCISPEGRIYREQIRQHLITHYENIVTHVNPIKLYIEFCFKDNRIHDIDNVLKGTIDALQDILYVNDKQIFELHARKFLCCAEDSINIEISRLEI